MSKASRKHCLIKASRRRREELLWKSVGQWMHDVQEHLIALSNRPSRPLWLELPEHEFPEGAHTSC